MITQSLYTFLTSNVSIARLTHSIYPQMLPVDHKGFPAITFAMDDDAEQTLLDGTTEGLREAQISVDCWDKSYLTVHSVSEAVRDALVGYTGSFGVHTVEQIRKERETELYEADTQLHRVSFQFTVAYSQE